MCNLSTLLSIYSSSGLIGLCISETATCYLHSSLVCLHQVHSLVMCQLQLPAIAPFPHLEINSPFASQRLPSIHQPANVLFSRTRPMLRLGYFFDLASSAALILSLCARLPPSFGPEEVVAVALAFVAGCLRDKLRSSACARNSALNAAAAAASGSGPSLL